MKEIKGVRERSDVLRVDYSCLSSKEVLKTVESIKSKIFSIMRHHIGEENHITQFELFWEVFGINPSTISTFERSYWWNIAKRIMKEMRRTDELFIVNSGAKLFVLQTQREADDLKERIDRNINNLKEVKKKADRWVRGERWKKI